MKYSYYRREATIVSLTLGTVVGLVTGLLMIIASPFIDVPLWGKLLVAASGAATMWVVFRASRKKTSYEVSTRE